jgi:SAM-dependent MidA family methyltransferase
VGIFTWREAMSRALYGPGGFFVDGTPAAHFRTSAHASPLFAGALARLVHLVDLALGAPDRLDLVDVGAGRGELLVALLGAVPPGLGARLRPVAVELAPRPAGLPERIEWRADLPARALTGVLLGTEWLDNVPLDLAALDPSGTARYLRTDDSLGEPLAGSDLAWVRRWWPLRPGARAEIGAPRDAAWAAAVAAVARGLAVAVDYGHLRTERPVLGTLTGFRGGRQVPPLPDGGCDLTAHVAFDALAAAVAGPPAPVLLRQREALRELGVSAARPALERAGTDPAGYLRDLARAGAAGELTDGAGLGGHLWLLCPVGIPCPLRSGIPCQT